MKTTVSANPQSVERAFWLVDLEGVTLGRAASRIAMVLRGKHKPIFTPHVDTGDFVIVVNAEKVSLTGRKEQQKMYHRHTGWLGGLKSVTLEKLRERKPTEILTIAVRGMLPKTSLGRQMLRKLKVYAGPEHPHQAQQPKPLDLKNI